MSALKAGANAYLHKPYKLEECLAYAHSLMKLYSDLHITENHSHILAVCMDLVIDPVRHQATLTGESLNLTRKEFDLLFCLVSHAGQVLSREQLYNLVWSESNGYNIDELIKTHIKTLRRKLTPAGAEYIKNVWALDINSYMRINIRSLGYGCFLYNRKFLANYGLCKQIALYKQGISNRRC